MRDIAESNRTEDNGVLTVEGLAALLHVTTATVYALNYRRTGPPFIRIGNAVRYRRTSVELWLREKEIE